MGMIECLARVAASRPHVFVVAVPGHEVVRIAAEATVARIGGVVAVSPAEADVLLIAGTPGPQLTGAIDIAWAQLPGPRARVRAATPGDVADALRTAVALLADTVGQTEDAHRRTKGIGGSHPLGELAMADRAADRDGLKLDVLHVPLGPILPAWPAGLVIHTHLQGDVIAEARAELLDTDTDAGAGSGSLDEAVAALDALARFLVVADWPDAATAAAGLRDDVHLGLGSAEAAARLRRLGSRLLRSRLLRAPGAGLGVVDGGLLELSGDANARWHRWLDTAAAVHDDGLLPDLAGEPATTRRRLDLACELIVGLELGAARVLVASLNIRPGELAPTSAARSIPVGVR